jgi:hypothetical protein
MPKINEDFLKSKRKNKTEERPDDFYIPSPKTIVKKTATNPLLQNVETLGPPFSEKSESNPRSISNKKAQGKKQTSELRLKPSQIELISDEIVEPCEPISLEYFDVTPFIPQSIKTPLVFKEKKGVFAIPHVIFEFRWKAIESKIELMVFDCLLRFTLGFHRANCNASNSFIAEWTGLHAPNVRKALKSLMDSGLIRRLEVGLKNHRASTFEIPIVKAYLSDRSRSEIQKKSMNSGKRSEIDSISDQINLRSNQSQNSDQINLRTEIDLISKKEITNKNTNKTLSAEIESYLMDNFESRSVAAREREKMLFLISMGKNQDEILELAKNLSSQGTLKGEKCDRPFSYLESGVYEKVLNRYLGKSNKSEFDPQRVYNSIARFNSREPLPEDFKSTMTASELEWIEKRGGRASLGMWPSGKLTNELRLN